MSGLTGHSKGFVGSSSTGSLSSSTFFSRQDWQHAWRHVSTFGTFSVSSQIGHISSAWSSIEPSIRLHWLLVSLSGDVARVSSSVAIILKHRSQLLYFPFLFIFFWHRQSATLNLNSKGKFPKCFLLCPRLAYYVNHTTDATWQTCARLWWHEIFWKPLPNSNTLQQ